MDSLLKPLPFPMPMPAAAAGGAPAPVLAAAAAPAPVAASGLGVEPAVQRAYDHAIPFRTIFEEYRVRREAELLYVAGEVFKQEPYLEDKDEGNARTELELRLRLARQESCYELLEQAAQAIANGSRREPLDALIADCHAADRDLKTILHNLNGHALCLSGGGIRSASFNLGVLEGLARFRDTCVTVTPANTLSYSERSASAKSGSFMNRMDYMSTVSGGGYIGSWLSSWVVRRRVATGQNAAAAYAEVLSALAGKGASTGGDPDPQQMRHLRRYTSFLAPELGASFDTAALSAIVLRNLLVNWTLLLPTLFALVSGTQCLAILLERAEAALPALHATGQALINISLVVLYLIAALAAARGLPSHRRRLAPIGSDKFSSVLRFWQARYYRRLKICRIDRVNGIATADLEKPLPEKWNGGLLNISEVTDSSFNGEVEIHRVSETRITFASKGDDAADNDIQNRGYLVIPKPYGNPVWWFTGCVLTATLLLSVARGQFARSSWTQILQDGLDGLLNYSVLGICIWAADLNRRRLLAGRSVVVDTDPWRTWRRLFGALGASVFAAAATSGLLFLLHRFGYAFLWNGAHDDWFEHKEITHRLFVLLAPPATMTILLVVTTLFCALLGVFEQEEDREWWARVGAVFLSCMICWTVLQAIVLYGTDLNAKLLSLALGGAGLALGLGASAAGYSGATAAGPRPVKATQLSGVARFLQKHNLVLPVIGGVALALIAIGVVACEEYLRARVAQSVFHKLSDGMSKGQQMQVLDAHWPSALLLFLLCLALTAGLNLAIDMNLFTLQGMYRMRLMRAFLGASNLLRRPDPFTKFDPADTPHMSELSAEPGAPLHVINAALNLTGTKDTALRQRMAENFTFTAIAAGGWRVGYARTAEFGGGPRGLTLATAMSISGSAFNPNMGYHTSPLLSLLMTFFNLRLGVWLPNPKWPQMKDMSREDALVHVSRQGPKWSLFTLISEAFGRANDGDKWIELTDGGHFENLGLYEMVLRRCKFIVVSDAGADVKCQFEDLGNAIRKIKIDLGVPIEFENTDRRPNLGFAPGMKPTNSYCAVARIGYHCVDPKPPGTSESDFDGWLIYLKASLTGREPGDVLQYALTHEDFPHEATANQFFNESQFESYRHLGSFMIDEIVKMDPARQNSQSPRPNDGTFKDLRMAAQEFWHRAV